MKSIYHTSVFSALTLTPVQQLDATMAWKQMKNITRQLVYKHLFLVPTSEQVVWRTTKFPLEAWPARWLHSEIIVPSLIWKDVEATRQLSNMEMQNYNRASNHVTRLNTLLTVTIMRGGECRRMPLRMCLMLDIEWHWAVNNVLNSQKTQN